MVSPQYSGTTAATATFDNVSVVPAGGATYTISGQVTSGGTGLSGVTMTLTGGASTLTATTDASGNYSIAGVASGGTYTLRPSKTGYTFSPDSM